MHCGYIPIVRRILLPLLIIFIISAGSFFFRLGALPLSGADEPRYARIAQEMLGQHNWVTPSLQGKPWMEKPPLYYWITIPIYYVFTINETTARIGPALCAMLTAIAIFILGSRKSYGHAGLFGACILITSLGFIGFGRSASTDMPFTCCLTIALAIFAAAVEKDLGLKVLTGYVFLGLAVLGKGPIAIILAAGIITIVWFLDERGVLLHNLRVIPGLIITAAVSLPWFWLVFHQNGYSFILTFFVNHNIARFFTGIHHHSQPFYYFIPVILALLLPWSGWLPVLIQSPKEGIKRWRQWDPLMVFLACWLLFPIIFFSLSDSKLAGYILPSLPPLALILGIRISRLIARPVENTRLRIAVMIHLLLSIAMAFTALQYFHKSYGGSWRTGILLSLSIVLPAFFVFGFGLKGQCLKAFSSTVIQGLIIIFATSCFAFPVLGAYHSTQDIAHQALAIRQPGEPITTYKFFHHSLHYYTGYQVDEHLENPESLIQFAQQHPNTLVITNLKGADEISSFKQLSTSILGKQGNFRLLRIKAVQ
jgi:4-amino-4-deoxy-L-arabinose transferase-like glycosyltransferase